MVLKPLAERNIGTECNKILEEKNNPHGSRKAVVGVRFELDLHKLALSLGHTYPKIQIKGFEFLRILGQKKQYATNLTQEKRLVAANIKYFRLTFYANFSFYLLLFG